ncbi:MAG: hypothetical protein RR090_02830 [Niameybacter sp.]|uniref:hypothetical protein n=2 Tax=Niameybacter sp. TaxID=2033640 RepID=UPI002FCBEE0F
MFNNHIKITNISDTMLNNVTLYLPDIKPDLSNLMVVRERGSLSFGPNTEKICLGNLYPEETAYLYYTVSTPIPTSSLFKNPPKIVFLPEGDEKSSENIHAFLYFEQIAE